MRVERKSTPGFEAVVDDLDNIPPGDAPPSNGADQSHAPSADPQGFDPSIHAVDKDGRPILTKSGKFRKKRKAAAQEEEHGEYYDLSVLASTSLVSLSVVLGGEEFQPIKHGPIDEMKNIQQAFERWFEAHEMNDLPPNIALVAALSAYYVPRFAQPGPREKLSKMWKWAKRWFK